MGGMSFTPGPYFGCKGRQARQRRSAELTNAKRRGSTRARIEAAIKLLQDQGERLTVAAIARQAGVSRQALYAHHRDLLPA